MMAGGAGQFTAPLPPPPLIPGLGSMSGDLSKMPPDLLAVLTAAAASQGGADPSMFSALAQLNSLSNNAMGLNTDEVSKPTKSHSKQPPSKPSSSSNQNSSSKQSQPGSNGSKASNQSQNSKPTSSSSSKPSPSSKQQQQHPPQQPTTPSPTSGKRPHRSTEDEPYQGLDLSIKRSEKPSRDESSRKNRNH